MVKLRGKVSEAVLNRQRWSILENKLDRLYKSTVILLFGHNDIFSETYDIVES